MNIKVDEHLLVNKKLKLKDNGSNTSNPATPSSVNEPKDGMNALMFQGMNKIVNDPQLATELKMFDKVATDEGNKKESAEEYVAPFKTNVAFQGRMAAKFKSVALATLMGIATLGTTSALQSCDDDKEIIEVPTPGPDINIEINIDLSAITAMFEQMQVMWQQMLDQQKITNEQLQQNNDFMKQLIDMYKQNSIDDKAFQEKLFNFMMSSAANQEVIIELLVQNGMKQDEANKVLNDILQQVKLGDLTAAEGMQKIMELLGDIKGILAQALSEFQKYAEESLRNQEDLIYVNKQGFREMVENGNITNETLEMITKQNEEFKKSQEKQIENQNKILEAIEKANLDSNANFEKVVETLNVNKKDLIGVLVQMGLEQKEIERMSANQIIAAIKENTKFTERGNKMLIEISEQLAILPELKEQGKVTNEQLKLFYEAFKDISNNQGQYSKEMLENMQVLLNQMKEISGTLDDLKEMFAQFMKDFQDVSKKVIQNQQDQMSIGKQAIEEISKYGEITSQTIVKIAEQNDRLEQSAAEHTKLLKDVIAVIQKADVNNQASIDELAEKMGVYKKDIIGVMVQLGLSQEEVMKMNKSEIVAAINDNTIMTQKGNDLLIQITKQIADLPNKIGGGSISQSQLNQILAMFNEISISQGQYSKEMISKMEVLLNKITDIQGTLDEILKQVSRLVTDFNSFRTEYSDNKKVEFKLLEELVKDNKFQNNVLVQMSAVQKDMAKNLNGVNANVLNLLEIAKDDSKHQELIKAIKSIQGGGVTNIDYNKLESMFNAMGMKIADVINMSSSQLQQAIKTFQTTYIKTEKENLDKMNEISKKIDNIKFADGIDKSEVINAINKLNQSIQNGSADITSEIKQLGASLDVIQAQLNSIYRAIGESTASANQFYEGWKSNFDKMFEKVDHIDSQLAVMIANQKTAEIRLDMTIKEVKEVKKTIENLNISGGGNIDMNKFEEILKNQSKVDFDNYSKLIQNLGIDKNQIKNIEELLKSIDSKMDYVKTNSDILNKIYDKLNSIDFSQPNYNAKLDQIIELLKNFKCNCDCGKGNEGILGDLDHILG